MFVRDAMSRDVCLANPEQTICEVASLMAEKDIGALPVGENDRLVGMITDRDIAIRAVACHESPDAKVRDMMSKEVLYCFEDEELERVAENMCDNKVRRMMVLSRDKRLVGMLSMGDLARHEHQTLAGGTIAHISQPGGAHSQTAH